MLYSLYLSFTDYSLLGQVTKWVGWANYQRVFSDPDALAAMKVTVVYVLIGVPGILIMAMAVALVLNAKIRFIKVYRPLYYLPSLLGTSVAVAALWRVVWGDDGLINSVLKLFGISHSSWIGSPRTALMTLIVLSVWSFGSSMVIFLAALKQTPQEVYEAASVDGAGRCRRFFSITLPLISPIIFFNSLMVTIHAFQAFTPAYVISSGTGGPANSTLFYTLYLYQQGFQSLTMGYASALGWVLALALGIVTGLFFWSQKYWVFYSE